MTKITLETRYGKYTVEVPEDDLPLKSLLELLIRPTLAAAGYAEETIRDALNVE